AAMRSVAGALAPKAAIVETLEALLVRNDFDCILLASPNYLHVDQLEQISAKAQVPILCEKPLYTTQEDAARVERLAKTHAAPVWVAMEYRYMPPVTAFIERVAHVTGGIRMMTIREHRFPFLPKIGNWNRFAKYSGGTLVEKCCHHFDLMRHVLGSDPVRVMASAGQDENHLNERYEGRVPDVWDNAYVVIDFANGARGMLDLCMFAEGGRYQEEILAVGPEGKLECFVPGPTRFWNRDLGPAPTPKLIESPRRPVGPRELNIPVDPMLLEAGDHNGSTYYQHIRFLEVVRGMGRVEVDLHDGAMAVMMGLAAQRSAATGQAVPIGQTF
ncbi:MAG: Gfo/Idh/MocA family oxidoreductase, partial [Pseudomonadota bacterium]